MPKVGDVVLFSAYGRTANALVLAVRRGISSHEGAALEPALTLAFVDIARESGPASNRIGPLVERPGYLPTVHIEHDVVHASHAFSDDYKRARGLNTAAQIASERGVGEWREYPSVPDPSEISPANPALPQTAPPQAVAAPPDSEEDPSGEFPSIENAAGTDVSPAE